VASRRPCLLEMKKLIKTIARSLGFELRRYSAVASSGHGPERESLEGSLEQCRALGFQPATVLDVGAAIGTFTRTCYEIFPQARYLLVEPLEEYLPSLRQVQADIPQATYTIAAAASGDGTLPLNVHEDLVGSSLYKEEEEGTNVNGAERKVPSVTLDRLVSDRRLPAPFLIKVDVQGAELDVLRGGSIALEGAEYVLLEVSLFQFFKDGPLFCEVVDFMQSKGFVPYDMFGMQYRPLDRALSQVDIVFVKERGAFRQQHCYATREQREAQNRQYRSYLQGLLSSK